jgi:hypothetical protein
MRSLNLEPCEPPSWARGGHYQTVLGHMLPQPTLRSKGRRAEIALPDGDRLVGFVQAGLSTTVVYLFHGLAGSTDSSYMHRTSLLMQKLGHNVIMVNHRGCGEGAGLAHGPYHSGRGEDLGAAIAFGRRHYPRHRHLAIGFSLSGNALLCLVSGMRGTDQPDAAIAVNAPVDLARCAVLLGQGFNRVYDLRFYLQCRRDVISGLGHNLIEYPLPRVSTLYQFDRLFTAPAGGFKDREDYYRTCSTYQNLSAIQTPTILLTAGDDPFVPSDSYRGARLSKNVRLHLEEHGGHMGYITKHKTLLGTRRWLDYALQAAVAAF